MQLKISAVLAAVIGVPAIASAQVSDVYAWDLRQNPASLLKFPVDAPADDVHATGMTYDTYALDFNADASTLYAITTLGSFGTIDTETGAFEEIAPLSGTPDGVTVTGLSISPTNEFYVSTVSALFSLDAATGTATEVGEFGVEGIMIDIAVDRTGLIYGHNIEDYAIYSIDSGSGAATRIGDQDGHGLGSTNFAQGMDFDWADNTLYATAYFGNGEGAFASFDLGNGKGTVIAETDSWNRQMEMAIASPIPEPAAISLLGLGSLALLRRRR